MASPTSAGSSRLTLSNQRPANAVPGCISVSDAPCHNCESSTPASAKCQQCGRFLCAAHAETHRADEPTHVFLSYHNCADCVNGLSLTLGKKCVTCPHKYLCAKHAALHIEREQHKVTSFGQRKPGMASSLVSNHQFERRMSIVQNMPPPLHVIDRIPSDDPGCGSSFASAASAAASLPPRAETLPNMAVPSETPSPGSSLRASLCAGDEDPNSPAAQVVAKLSAQLSMQEEDIDDLYERIAKQANALNASHASLRAASLGSSAPETPPARRNTLKSIVQRPATSASAGSSPPSSAALGRLTKQKTRSGSLRNLITAGRKPGSATAGRSSSLASDAGSTKPQARTWVEGITMVFDAFDVGRDGVLDAVELKAWAAAVQENTHGVVERLLLVHGTDQRLNRSQFVTVYKERRARVGDHQVYQEMSTCGIRPPTRRGQPESLTDCIELMFEMFDVDCDLLLNYSEMMMWGTKTTGQPADPEQIKQTALRFAKIPSRGMTMDDFLGFYRWQTEQSETSTKEDIRACGIPLPRRKMNRPLTFEDAIERMFRRFDKDLDGVLNDVEITAWGTRTGGQAMDPSIVDQLKASFGSKAGLSLEQFQKFYKWQSTQSMDACLSDLRACGISQFGPATMDQAFEILFQMFDADGDGQLGWSEIKAWATRTAGQCPPDDALRAAIATHGDAGSDRLTLAQFVAFYEWQTGQSLEATLSDLRACGVPEPRPETPETYEEAYSFLFRLCDEDGDGYLSDAELNRWVLITSGQPAPPGAIDQVKQMVGVTGSVGMTEAQFCAFYEQQTAQSPEATNSDLKTAGVPLPQPRFVPQTMLEVIDFIFDRFDKDVDGLLSLAELGELTKQMNIPEKPAQLIETHGVKTRPGLSRPEIHRFYREMIGKNLGSVHKQCVILGISAPQARPSPVVTTVKALGGRDSNFTGTSSPPPSPSSPAGPQVWKRPRLPSENPFVKAQQVLDAMGGADQQAKLIAALYGTQS